MLRWIAFDAVGTVIYPQPDVATAYYQMGQKYGSSSSLADLKSRFWAVFQESQAACLTTEAGQLQTNETSERQRWRWIVDHMLPDVSDADACFADLYEHFALPEKWAVFDDVPESFRKLKQAGYHIAIASNFDQRLHRLMNAIDTFQVVDLVVVSTDVGYCKPSTRFYEKLLHRCRCEPRELLMIGDELEADVLGPKQLGIAALQIDRKAHTGFNTLSNLPQWLLETQHD